MATQTVLQKNSDKRVVLEEGTVAPSFSLPADDGSTVSLEALRGRLIVLYFYPKDDTPGCTREAQGFQQRLEEFHALGAVILGVSRDGAAAHTAFKVKYQLAYQLLCDPDVQVHTNYGAWGKKTLYGKETTGVIRTTVILDAEGRVAKVFPNVRVDGHADKVLAEVQRLHGQE